MVRTVKNWLMRRGGPLNYIGRVTSAERARFVALMLEMGTGILAGFVESRLFGTPFSWSTFGQSFVINSMGSYANVGISQHKGFNYGQIAGYRAFLGILKGSTYRGICSTPSVTTGTSFLIQALFGLWAMGFADRITSESHRPSATLARIGNLLSRTPNQVSSLVNHSLSFWGAIAVRAGTEFVFPRLARIGSEAETTGCTEAETTPS